MRSQLVANHSRTTISRLLWNVQRRRSLQPFHTTSAAAAVTTTIVNSAGAFFRKEGNGYGCNNRFSCTSSSANANRRYFGSRGKKNNDSLKKKKRKRLGLASSNKSVNVEAPYGTPRTGLILPNQTQTQPLTKSSSSDGAGTGIGSSSSDTSLSFQPMVDMNIGNIHHNNNNTHSQTIHDDAFTQSLQLQGQATPPQSTLFQDLGQDDAISPVVTSSPPTHNFNSSSSSGSGSLNSIFDVTSMYDPKIHLPNKPDFSNPTNQYEPSTPLGEELMKYIGVLGCPITVAEYMKRCLRDERYGYYTNPPSTSTSDSDLFDDDDDDDDIEDMKDMEDNDTDITTKKKMEGRGHKLIGPKGDFTTAPEISQIFGECITIWLLTQYEAIGKPKHIQLIELGPGRGTLMCDIVRSALSIKGPGQEFVMALMNGNGNDEDAAGSTSTSTGGSISGVHFVEVSDNLKVTQREALQTLLEERQKTKKKRNDTDANNVENDIDVDFHFVPWKSKEQRMTEMKNIMNELREKKKDGQDVDAETLAKLMAERQQREYAHSHAHDGADGDNDSNSTGRTNSISVHWHDSFDSVPFQTNVTSTTSGGKESTPTFIIGQEFLDALPVHVFQKTNAGWRERMVDVAIEDDDEGGEEDGSNKVQVQMRDGTTAKINASASSAASGSKKQKGDETDMKKKARFRHVLSPGVTPALRSLLRIGDDGQPMNDNTSQNVNHATTLNDAPDGTIMEVCPEALSLIQDIALRVEECNGAALMIDYGNEGSQDTLRAFRRHEQVDILSSPGTVDLTADVDFGALRNAVNVDMKVTSQKMGEVVMEQNDGGGHVTHPPPPPEAFGPQTQGHFLASMGAVERTINLIEDDSTTDEQADDLCTALERLVSEDEMGERFKVLAICRKKDGIFPPPGF